MNKQQKNDQEPFFWIKSGRDSQKSPANIPRQGSIKARQYLPRREERISPEQGQSARAGLQPGWIRATFIVREGNLQKLKSLAYRERKGIKDILDEALTGFLVNKKPVSNN
jgi:hypothetical protein